MAIPLINVTQTINGYCDPNVYGVVVAFKRFGDRQEYTAYVDFDRKRGELNSPTEVSKEPKPNQLVSVEISGWVLCHVETVAHEFAGSALPDQKQTEAIPS
jgi:hypothetical protein